MITRIEISGFKSFHDFAMDLTPFTVIAGANPSGKSNLFDALRLLGHLAAGQNLNKALEQQRGGEEELFLHYGPGDTSKELTFAVEMLLDKKVQDRWGGQATLTSPRLRYELTLVKKQDGIVGVQQEGLCKIKPPRR